MSIFVNGIDQGGGAALSDADPDAITHGQAAGSGASGDASRGDHAHAMDALPIGVVWAQPHMPFGDVTLSAQSDRYAVASFPDTGSVQGVLLALPIPADFSAISKAVIVVKSAGTTGDLRWRVLTTFAADGQTAATHSENTAYANVAVTNGLLKFIDISAAMSAVAAGDIFGVQFLREGTHVDDDITVLDVHGMLLEYSR